MNDLFQSNEKESLIKSESKAIGLSRCLALEQAYVHDVYSQIATEWGACSPVRSHVKDFFFNNFESGSLLIDIGCGDGKYLNLRSDLFTIGLERCSDWFDKDSKDKSFLNNSDVLIGDVLYLPVRDEFFDGVLCCGVLHHISTTDRRIAALQEIVRIIKIGGKLLITVWASEGRELESQDVLIKWNSSKRKRMDFHLSGSSEDEDTSSCSTSSTNTTNYVNRKAAYESCNSPTSQFGTCYNFVCKALQRFNIPSPPPLHQTTTSALSTGTKNFSSLSFTSSAFKRCSDKFDSDSSLSSLNSMSVDVQNVDQNVKSSQTRKPSLFQSGLKSIKNKSRLQNGSLFSIIKDYILPKPVKNVDNQFKSSKSFKSIKTNGFLDKHRLSLPVAYMGYQNRDPEVMQEIIDSFTSIKSQLPEATDCAFNNKDNSKSEIELTEVKEIEGKRELNSFDKDESYVLKKYTKRKKEYYKILQKSLSSDSLESKHSKQSRQLSVGTETTNTTTTTTTATTSTSTSEGSARLTAYYSMPELRLLSWSSCDEEDTTHTCLCVTRTKPKLTDLHPITFLKQIDDLRNIERNDSQDTQTAIEEIDSSTNLCSLNQEAEDKASQKRLKEKLKLPLFIQSPASPTFNYDITNDDKLIKNEKTMRSLSVEYKPQICSSYRQGLRRFSVSPSLLAFKPFVQFVPQSDAHETYPSVGSEESFVTIIPANKSCHEANTIESGNNNDDDSFVDDVIIDFEPRSELVTEDEEVLCENISNNLESDDLTSPSTATTKSIKSQTSSQSHNESKSSTPLPPTNLHRYFHLFRCGELEELIETHVHNLYVIKSYYSEHATSWCVIAEKVHVWTI